MKNIWKKQYKNILLVIGYTIVACTVYGVWVHSAWNLWYVDLIVVLLIIIVGFFLGYFFVKAEIRAENSKREKEKMALNLKKENQEDVNSFNNLEKK